MFLLYYYYRVLLIPSEFKLPLIVASSADVEIHVVAEENISDVVSGFYFRWRTT
jgi:hypothetical protein